MINVIVPTLTSRRMSVRTRRNPQSKDHMRHNEQFRSRNVKNLFCVYCLLFFGGEEVEAQLLTHCYVHFCFWKPVRRPDANHKKHNTSPPPPLPPSKTVRCCGKNDNVFFSVFLVVRFGVEVMTGFFIFERRDDWCGTAKRIEKLSKSRSTRKAVTGNSDSFFLRFTFWEWGCTHHKNHKTTKTLGVERLQT